MLVQRAMDLRLGDQLKSVRGKIPSFVFKTPSRDRGGCVTVVALERVFGPKIKITVIDGVDPAYASEPPRFTEEFACLELMELKPRPKLTE